MHPALDWVPKILTSLSPPPSHIPIHTHPPPLTYPPSSHVLSKVCQYFTYKVRYTNSSTEIPEFPISREIALELLMAANFLDCWEALVRTSYMESQATRTVLYATSHIRSIYSIDPVFPPAVSQVRKIVGILIIKHFTAVLYVCTVWLCSPWGQRSSATRENLFLIKISTTCYSWGGRGGTVKLCRGSGCTSHWRTVRERLWLHAWTW